MSNQTAKQIGIPSGYRLTESNSNNIKMVAIMNRFGKEMLSMAIEEIVLLNLVISETYPEKKLEALKKAVRDINPNANDITEKELSIEVDTGDTSFTIGGTYCKPYPLNKCGIISHSSFIKYLDNMPANMFKEKFGLLEVQHKSNHFLWLKHSITSLSPRDHRIKLGTKASFACLSKSTKNKVTNYAVKVEKLRNKINKVVDLLTSILATYSSALKLCKDAPEFIDYINDSSVYNKHGKKCTDINTIDMIRELKNE